MSARRPGALVLLVVALAAGCERDLALPEAPTVAAIAPLALAPPAAVTSPGGAVAFQASGGTPPYAFSCPNCAEASGSGGTIDAEGRYAAGPRGEVVDEVRLEDARGAALTATVSVRTALTVLPSFASVAPLEPVDLLVLGGLPPYAASFEGGPRAASGGAVQADGDNAALLHYVAGPAGEVVDRLVVTDSAGTARTVELRVSRSLALDPTLLTLGAGEASLLVPTGGAGPFDLEVRPEARAGGAYVDAFTGRIVGGEDGPGADLVRVRDRFGAAAESIVVSWPHHLAGSALPRSVAIAELGGDAGPEVVVASSSQAGLDVLSFDEAGSLRSRSLVQVDGGQPIAAALADVSAPDGSGPDGLPDLLVVVSGPGRSALQLRPGLGAPEAFGPPLGEAALPFGGVGEIELAVARLTRDGAPDVAAVVPGDERLALVDARPDGTLLPLGQPRTLGAPALGVAAGPLDAGGLDTLAITLVDQVRADSVLLLRPEGDTAAAARETLHVTGAALVATPVLADVDGDGATDLAVTSIQGGLFVLLADGAGGFAPPLDAPELVSCTALVAADTDGRPGAELYAAHRDQLAPPPADVVVAFGFRDGDFVSLGRVPLAASPLLGLGATGTARPLLFAALPNERRFAATFLPADGGLGPGPSVRIPGSDPTSLWPLALDGLAGDELAVADSGVGIDVWVTRAPSSELRALGVRGQGLAAPLRLALADLGSTQRVAAGDADEDGLPDLVALAVDHAGTFLGREDGTFEGAGTVLYRRAPLGGGALVDADGDGHLDLALADGAADELVVLRCNGRGVFGGELRGPSIPGLLDLAATAPGELVALSSAGLTAVAPAGAGGSGLVLGGTVALPSVSALLRVRASSAGEDGRLDALLDGTADTVFVRDLLGSPQVFALVDRDPGARAAALDADGDGALDWVVALAGGAVVRGFPLEAGSSRSRSWATPLRAVVDLVAADVDGDGRADLALLDRDAGLHVLFGGPGGLAGERTLPGAARPGEACGTAADCAGSLDACAGGRCVQGCRSAADCPAGGACSAPPNGVGRCE